MKKKVSFIILNYKGKHLLEKYLPSIQTATADTSHEVIIVDNGSQDESVVWAQKTFPHFKVLSLPQNVYFSRANNEGAKIATGDLLLFLNNDLEVTPHFLDPLLDHFLDPTVFAVSPRVLRPLQNNDDEGIIAGHFKGGCINPDNMVSKKMPPVRNPIEIFNACGAAMLVDRAKFFQLDGFDPLFHPFYLEETDLCYRAWKQGWRSLYDPNSTVYHLHNQTIQRMVGNERTVSYRKNQYLFIWKNIEDPLLLLSHFFQLFLPKCLIPNRYEWQAIGQALRQLPEAIQRRKKAPKSKWGDQWVFKQTHYLVQYIS